jgi:hypothetical protein
MLILKESLNFNQAGLIIESGPASDDGKPKDLFLKGIFIQGGVQNLNGREYPVREIERAVKTVNDTLKSGESVCGELDHPEELTINLDRVSHMITEMWMDGSSGMGKLKIIDKMPMGQIARALIEAGVKLGVSSRGSGNVQNGKVSDFEIVTVDIVAKPSAPNAYPKAIYEGLNGRRGHILEDLARAAFHDPKAQKFLHMELLNWVNKL